MYEVTFIYSSTSWERIDSALPIKEAMEAYKAITAHLPGELLLVRKFRTEESVGVF